MNAPDEIPFLLCGPLPFGFVSGNIPWKQHEAYRGTPSLFFPADSGRKTFGGRSFSAYKVGFPTPFFSHMPRLDYTMKGERVETEKGGGHTGVLMTTLLL